MQSCLLATCLAEINVLLSFGWLKFKSFGNATGHSNELPQGIFMEKLKVLLVIYGNLSAINAYPSLFGHLVDSFVRRFLRFPLSH